MKKFNKDDALNIMKKYTELYSDGYLSDTITNVTIDDIILDKELINVTTKNKVVSYVPYVIEPSIGMDRIFYALMLSTLKAREIDTNRVVMTLNKNIFTYDLMIAQLSNHDDLIKKTDSIVRMLDKKLRIFTDSSSVGIGKRYVRADEIGIPFTVTVDFESLKDDTVTIRYRDSTLQDRINIADIYEVIKLKSD